MLSLKAVKAIFLIFIISFAHLALAQNSKKASLDIYNRIKRQVVDMVLMNQRPQSIALIDTEIKNADLDTKNKLIHLKFNTLNEFLSLPAQEAYEAAASTSLNEKKRLSKNIQECLKLEPDNLHCQWLELKYLHKYDQSQFNENALKYIETIQDFKQSQLAKLQLARLVQSEENFNFKTSDLSKNANYEEDVLAHVLDYQLALKNKNYEKAKLNINHLVVVANDYPDIIFMKYQLATLNNLEEITESQLEKQNDVYKMKCDGLPARLVRKYYFDIELCTRSLN